MGPLPIEFTYRNYTSSTSTSPSGLTSSCPYDSHLCTGPNPPTQPGCENICLTIQISNPNGGSHGPVLVPTLNSTATSTQTTSILSVSTTATTGKQNYITSASGNVPTVITSFQQSSSRLDYLDYTIPIIIGVIAVSLALLYYFLRISQNGKEIAKDSLQSLQRESTRIRQSHERVDINDQIIEIDAGLADNDWKDDVKDNVPGPSNLDA